MLAHRVEPVHVSAETALVSERGDVRDVDGLGIRGERVHAAPADSLDEGADDVYTANVHLVEAGTDPPG